MTQQFPARRPAMSANPNRFNLAEFRSETWLATPESGTKIEDMLQPSYWAHVSGRLKPLSKIDVYPESGEFFATLLVVRASRTEAVVKLLYINRFDETGTSELPETSGESDDIEELEVTWGGPSSKFRVVRKKDKVVLKDGFSSKEEANLYKTDYIKALAA